MLYSTISINILVDMLTYAIDTPAPATIILISGDRDFVYAVSVLRFRRYNVVVIAPGSAHASLKSRASEILDWDHDVLGKPFREGHARHVSADVSSARGPGIETEIGLNRRANRRHSFRDPNRTYSSYTRSPGRPHLDDLEVAQDSLRVPMQDSFPPSPHQYAHGLRADASGMDAHDSIAGGVPADGNVVRGESKLATVSMISPITPGITVRMTVFELRTEELTSSLRRFTDVWGLLSSPTKSINALRQLLIRCHC